MLAGSLEPRALGFGQERARLGRDEIVADTERARRNEPLLAFDQTPSKAAARRSLPRPAS